VALFIRVAYDCEQDPSLASQTFGGKEYHGEAEFGKEKGKEVVVLRTIASGRWLRSPKAERRRGIGLTKYALFQMS